FLHARILWKGQPLEGALVNAWHMSTGAEGRTRTAGRDSVGITWSGRTDSLGEVTIPVAQDGEGLGGLVHLGPYASKDQTDWESTWASLTFRRAVQADPRRDTQIGTPGRARTSSIAE